MADFRPSAIFGHLSLTTLLHFKLSLEENLVLQDKSWLVILMIRFSLIISSVVNGGEPKSRLTGRFTVPYSRKAPISAVIYHCDESKNRHVYTP